MRLGIAGITGRMGRLLIEECLAAGAELSGGTRRPASSAALQPDAAATQGSQPHILPDIAALAARSDAVIDFTHAAAAAAHAGALAEGSAAWVLGTSGLGADDEAAVLQASRRIPVVYAPNFAPGVTLVLAMAERLAAALPPEAYDAEIVELHHRQKVDAPSGTAIGLGRAVAAGRGVDLAQVMESGRNGHAGPRRPGAIGFAALRGGQVVGEHTLLFAGASEHIAVTHRAFDRRVFAAGAVRAALWTQGRAPGLYSMVDVLGMR